LFCYCRLWVKYSIACWISHIDAKDRIGDIEEGVEPTSIEIIQNPKGSIKRAYDLSASPTMAAMLASVL
jgi:hypothetical protein